MSTCTAHSSRTGEPCKAIAVRGSNVCVVHGGKAPQVQRAIKQRILEAADPALGEMIRLFSKSKVDAVRRQAAADILDRAGYKAPDRLEHAGADGGPVQIAVLYKNANGTTTNADEE